MTNYIYCCIVCKKQWDQTACRSCIAKAQWANNPKRKEQVKERWTVANPSSPGMAPRRKGKKNKKPYPMSEAVIQRMRNLHSMPHPWLNRKHKKETKRKMSIARNAYFDRGGKFMASYKGRYTPKNPQKYKGDPTKVIYRSLWELKVFKYFDEHPDVLEWSSEEVIVWYVSPLDGRPHRYFPDVYVKMRTKDGSISERILEVKPDKETKQPEIKKSKSKKYITEVAKWGVNSAKWEAAKKYAQQRGWEFHVITENHIFGKS